MGYINDVVKSAGMHSDNVELKKVSGGSVNKWGDRSGEDVETVEITGMVELLSGESQEVVEGDYESGDVIVYVDGYQEGLRDDNILVYQGKEYRIEEVLEMEVGHESHLEVRASRV